MGQDHDDLKLLKENFTEAAKWAPALRARFDAANFDLKDLAKFDDLASLPVLKKEDLLSIQRRNPPFGGYLGVPANQLGRIYVSPGPIYEPALLSETSGHGLELLFNHAGLGAEDIMLNTWSYHLVPAGLLFDDGARAVGATVIPGGVGNSELQAQIIVEAGVTAICASTSFFLKLADLVHEKYGSDAWQVRTAFLGGEMGDWMAKRAQIEADYGVKSWAAYASADLGLIATEDGNGEGYLVHPRRIVQICDPGTGKPLPQGETGEVVVTTLDATWPMIRFGTGDSAYALSQTEDGRVERLSPLQGRVGAAVKVREIFIYPRAIEEIVIATPGIERAQGVALAENGREVMTLRVVCSSEGDQAQVQAQAAEQFQRFTRIKLERIEFVDADDLKPDAELIVNKKD